MQVRVQVHVYVCVCVLKYTHSSDDSSRQMTHLHILVCVDDSRRSPAKFTRESYRLATVSVETPFTKPNLCHSTL